MVTQASLACPLLDIPTELLVQILSYLSYDDLCLLQGTCRRIKDIVAGTAYLEYLLHTGIDNVDDLLPSDVPLPTRLELLKHHERSWSDLRFSVFSEFFMMDDNTRNSNNVARYTLQNGYLILSDSIPVGQGLKYRYIDLYSLSPGEEVNWIPIRLRVIRPRSIVFAADHNLVVAITFGIFC
jgi:F-box associated protein